MGPAASSTALAVDRGVPEAAADPAEGPRFSVVTVVYNDLDGLRATRDSIAAQAFRNFEWIVVDGGSTDGTAEFLEGHPEAVTHWVSGPDAGIYDAMNKGLALATGAYVVFMNAGDRFAGPGVLGQVSARLDGAGPAPDVLFGGATLVFPGGRRWYRGPRNMERYIWHGLPAIHQATYYRRSRVRDTGYDPSYRVCGDYEIVARLFTGGASAAYLDAPLVDFMVGGTSFRTRGPLFAEPLRVQTEILHAGPLRKALSLARRLVSTVAVTVLHGRGGASPEGHSPVRPRGA